MAPLPPVDPNVELPPSVKRAAARAARVHAAAYQTPEPAPDPQPQLAPEPQPAPNPAPAPEPVPQPAPDPQPAPEPQPVPQPVPEPQPQVTPEQWEHRYNSMRGRFEQGVATITQMQENMQALGNELQAAHQTISQLRAGSAPAAAPVPHLVTEEDRKTYGPELLDLIARQAREAVMPDVQNTQNQVRQVNQRVAQTATSGVYQALDERIPNWREINTSPRFKQWCGLLDVYSGQVRGGLLKQAFQAANAPRVLAFFQGFVNDEVATGNMPAPQNEPLPAPRVAAVPLENMVAPGRPHPAPGNNTPASQGDKPIFTRAQVSKFYADSREMSLGKGPYAGREADKARDEAAIYLAQREGRVR